MTRTNREVVDWMHKLVHEGAEMKLKFLKQWLKLSAVET